MREPRQRRGVLVVVLLVGGLTVALFGKPSVESLDVGQTASAESSPQVATDIAAAKGETVDLGVGPQGDYANDTTPVRVTVSVKAGP